MAPVCVRVAFIGGGQGEPSRWAGPHGAHRAACLCSMVLRPVERLVFSPKER